MLLLASANRISDLFVGGTSLLRASVSALG